MKTQGNIKKWLPTLILTTASVNAQTSINNSITKKMETTITTKESISFQRENLRLAGHLFKPANFDLSQKYQALIVQGSVSSVKEMMPDNYAQLLAKEGFVVIDFDYASWGESDGLPRQNENVEGKLKDLQAAVTFLESLGYVDKIGMVGVCTSGGKCRLPGSFG